MKVTICRHGVRTVAVLISLSVTVTPRSGLARGAQTPAPQPAAPAAPAGGQPATAAAPAAPAEPYSYNPEGRRDPFVSLLARGTDPGPAGKRGAGLGSLTTAEIVVRGVLQSLSSYVAIVQGPDMKTYIVRINDRLADGIVKNITPQGLVIIQEVNDPLSLVKQREVRKGLRASENAQ